MTRRHLLAAPAAAFAQASPAPAIGIIGTGNRASAHFRAYPQLSEARIVALSDLESDRMEVYNKTLPQRAATYTDWRELLKDPRVGIVVITAPNFLHHDMAIAALRAGKHVLLEKPIAISYALARRIQAEAKSSGRILAVGMQRRYWAMDTHIQQLVEGGLIGPIRFISISEYRGDWSPRGWQYTDPATGAKTNWRFLKKLAGSTELEFSVHAFSQVTQLVKSPLTRCVASGGVLHYKGRDMRDLCTGLIDFDNGVRFNYSFCLFSQGTPGSMTIVGDKGTLRHSGGGRLLLDTPGRPGQEPPPLTGHSAELPEVQMYKEFFRAIAENRTPALDAELAIDAVKIAYAMDMAISENRIVTALEFT